MTICLAQLQPIPNSGKFFYATLQMGDTKQSVDHMFMEVLIGNTTTSNSSQKFQLALSTQKSHLDVFSQSCPNTQCRVKQKYYKDISKTYTESDENEPFTFETKALFNGYSNRDQVTLKGEFGAEDFRIRMNGFNRETLLVDLDFARLICSTCPYDDNVY